MLLSNEDLFLCSVAEMRERMEKDNPYDYLRACALCRQLVFDKNEQPLIDLVDANGEFELTFTIANIKRFKKGKHPFHVYWENPDPEKHLLVHGPTERVILSKKEFLSTRILHHYKEAFTVLDIFEAAWYAMGGIHSGISNRIQKALAALDLIAGGDKPISFYALKSISAITLRALQPFEERIKDLQRKV